MALGEQQLADDPLSEDELRLSWGEEYGRLCYLRALLRSGGIKDVEDGDVLTPLPTKRVMVVTINPVIEGIVPSITVSIHTSDRREANILALSLWRRTYFAIPGYVATMKEEEVYA